MNCPDPRAMAGGSPDGEATQVDRFFEGRFALVQPSGRGFRAGLDALLLAASVPAEARGVAVDVGSGSGGVGFAAATRARHLAVLLVEREEELTALHDLSLGLAVNGAIAPRLRSICVDLFAGEGELQAAGLLPNSADLVLTNPPFYPVASRASPDALRARALRVEDGEALGRWLRRSASLLRRRGRLHAILRPADLPAATGALQGRLGGLRVLPVHTRPGAATRILLGAAEGSRAELAILPGVQLYGRDGAPDDLSHAVSAGEATLRLFD